MKVLRYPLHHSKGNHGIFRTDTPGLYVSGEITNAEGSVQRIDADETWRCLIDPNFEIISESAVFAPLQIYEKVTGDAKNADWLKAGFDVGDWPMATEERAVRCCEFFVIEQPTATRTLGYS